MCHLPRSSVPTKLLPQVFHLDHLPRSLAPTAIRERHGFTPRRATAPSVEPEGAVLGTRLNSLRATQTPPDRELVIDTGCDDLVDDVGALGR